MHARQAFYLLSYVYLAQLLCFAFWDKTIVQSGLKLLTFMLLPLPKASVTGMDHHTHLPSYSFWVFLGGILFYSYWCLACQYVCTPCAWLVSLETRRGQQTCWNQLQMLWVIMWVLGTDSKSSRRTVYTNLWAISLALLVTVLKRKNVELYARFYLTLWRHKGPQVRKLHLRCFL